MLPEAIQKKVQFELSRIDKLLGEFGDLLHKASSGGMDNVQTAATAHVLHSFYNGIEKIIQLILKAKEVQVPESQNWHRLVLEAAVNDLGLLRIATKAALIDYLGFRHVVRHRYSMELDEKRMRTLCAAIGEVWSAVSTDIHSFLSHP